MLISELVAELKKAKRKYGNIRVVTTVGQGKAWPCEPHPSITYTYKGDDGFWNEYGCSEAEKGEEVLAL